MKKFLLILTSSSLTAGVYQQAICDYQVDHKQAHVLEIAKSIPNRGVLKKKSNGYVYLDISNDFIFKIFPNLILDGHLRPTNSFGAEEGTHITVVTDTEHCLIEEEIGQEFTFEIKELRFVESWKTSGVNGQYKHHIGDRWLVAVESPQLEELRMRYGLPSLVEGHDFHISIGFEVPFNRINNFGERPLTLP